MPAVLQWPRMHMICSRMNGCMHVFVCCEQCFRLESEFSTTTELESESASESASESESESASASVSASESESEDRCEETCIHV